MFRYLRVFPIIVFLSVLSNGYAQEINSSYPDSIKIDISKPIIIEHEMNRSGQAIIKLPRLNPADKIQLQFSPFYKFNLSTPQYTGYGPLPEVNWNGVASDFIFSKSRTAIASTMPTNRLLLHSSATIGIIETPFFGKAVYYSVNAGGLYFISPDLNVGLRSGYSSNYDIIPTWNVAADVSYMINRNLMIDGSLSYLQTANNQFNVNQGVVNVDLHTRYRINNDWFLNGYGGAPVKHINRNLNQPLLPMMNTPYFGGTVEHWFKPTMGVEGGMIWTKDMMTGKMRARPKLELKFRPGS